MLFSASAVADFRLTVISSSVDSVPVPIRKSRLRVSDVPPATVNWVVTSAVMLLVSSNSEFSFRVMPAPLIVTSRKSPALGEETPASEV